MIYLATCKTDTLEWGKDKILLCVNSCEHNDILSYM